MADVLTTRGLFPHSLAQPVYLRSLLDISPQLLAGCGGVVDVAFVQGSSMARCITERLVELELQHEAHEVPADRDHSDK